MKNGALRSRRIAASKHALLARIPQVLEKDLAAGTLGLRPDDPEVATALQDIKKWAEAASENVRAPVTVDAVVKRINHKLPAEFELARFRRRGLRSRCDGYYIINWADRTLVDNDVNLEALGRETGVLESWEFLIG